jgi:hypothetical protein
MGGNSIPAVAITTTPVTEKISNAATLTSLPLGINQETTLPRIVSFQEVEREKEQAALQQARAKYKERLRIAQDFCNSPEYLLTFEKKVKAKIQ